MKKVTSIWLEPADKVILERLRMVGLRETSRRTGVDATVISRWMRGHTGMRSENAEKVIDFVAQEMKKLAIKP